MIQGWLNLVIPVISSYKIPQKEFCVKKLV